MTRTTQQLTSQQAAEFKVYNKLKGLYNNLEQNSSLQRPLEDALEALRTEGLLAFRFSIYHAQECLTQIEKHQLDQVNKLLVEYKQEYRLKRGRLIDAFFEPLDSNDKTRQQRRVKDPRQNSVRNELRPAGWSRKQFQYFLLAVNDYARQADTTKNREEKVYKLMCADNISLYIQQYLLNEITKQQLRDNIANLTDKSGVFHNSHSELLQAVIDKFDAIEALPEQNPFACYEGSPYKIFGEVSQTVLDELSGNLRAVNKAVDQVRRHLSNISSSADQASYNLLDGTINELLNTCNDFYNYISIHGYNWQVEVSQLMKSISSVFYPVVLSIGESLQLESDRQVPQSLITKLLRVGFDINYRCSIQRSSPEPIRQYWTQVASNNEKEQILFLVKFQYENVRMNRAHSSQTLKQLCEVVLPSQTREGSLFSLQDMSEISQKDKHALLGIACDPNSNLKFGEFIFKTFEKWSNVNSIDRILFGIKRLYNNVSSDSIKQVYGQALMLGAYGYKNDNKNEFETTELLTTLFNIAVAPSTNQDLAQNIYGYLQKSNYQLNAKREMLWAFKKQYDLLKTAEQREFKEQLESLLNQFMRSQSIHTSSNTTYEGWTQSKLMAVICHNQCSKELSRRVIRYICSNQQLHRGDLSVSVDVDPVLNDLLQLYDTVNYSKSNDRALVNKCHDYLSLVLQGADQKRLLINLQSILSSETNDPQANQLLNRLVKNCREQAQLGIQQKLSACQAQQDSNDDHSFCDRQDFIYALPVNQAVELFDVMTSDMSSKSEQAQLLQPLIERYKENVQDDAHQSRLQQIINRLSNIASPIANRAVSTDDASNSEDSIRISLRSSSSEQEHGVQSQGGSYTPENDKGAPVSNRLAQAIQCQHYFDFTKAAKCALQAYQNQQRFMQRVKLRSFTGAITAAYSCFRPKSSKALKQQKLAYKIVDNTIEESHQNGQKTFDFRQTIGLVFGCLGSGWGNQGKQTVRVEMLKTLNDQLPDCSKVKLKTNKQGQTKLSEKQIPQLLKNILKKQAEQNGNANMPNYKLIDRVVDIVYDRLLNQGPKLLGCRLWHSIRGSNKSLEDLNSADNPENLDKTGKAINILSSFYNVLTQTGQNVDLIDSVQNFLCPRDNNKLGERHDNNYAPPRNVGLIEGFAEAVKAKRHNQTRFWATKGEQDMTAVGEKLHYELQTLSCRYGASPGIN